MYVSHRIVPSMQSQSVAAYLFLVLLVFFMNKLLSSLVAATIAGAFSLSAMAADATPVAPAGATAAEKPAAAPKAKKHVKKHVKKHATKKAEEKKSDAAAPAESAK